MNCNLKMENSVLYSPSLYDLGSRTVIQLHSNSIISNGANRCFSIARVHLISLLNKVRAPLLTRFGMVTVTINISLKFCNNSCMLCKRPSSWFRSLDSSSTFLCNSRIFSSIISLYWFRTWAWKLFKSDTHLSVWISRRAFWASWSWIKEELTCDSEYHGRLRSVFEELIESDHTSPSGSRFQWRPYHLRSLRRVLPDLEERVWLPPKDPRLDLSTLRDHFVSSLACLYDDDVEGR